MQNVYFSSSLTSLLCYWHHILILLRAINLCVKWCSGLVRADAAIRVHVRNYGHHFIPVDALVAADAAIRVHVRNPVRNNVRDDGPLFIFGHALHALIAAGPLTGVSVLGCADAADASVRIEWSYSELGGHLFEKHAVRADMRVPGPWHTAVVLLGLFRD